AGASPREIDDEPALVRRLIWRKAGTGWRLFADRRRFGEIVPDAKYPGMWRVKLSGGRLSDMTNLSWARNAVLEAAIGEIEYEARHAATTPTKSQQIEDVFPQTSLPMSQPEAGGLNQPPPPPNHSTASPPPPPSLPARTHRA